MNIEVTYPFSRTDKLHFFENQLSSFSFFFLFLFLRANLVNTQQLSRIMRLDRELELTMLFESVARFCLITVEQGSTTTRPNISQLKFPNAADL